MRERRRTRPEALALFVVSGSDDFLVLVAVSDTRHLEAFVLDHIAQHPDIADVRTSLVYEHLQHLPIEPLDPPAPFHASNPATCRLRDLTGQDASLQSVSGGWASRSGIVVGLVPSVWVWTAAGRPGRSEAPDLNWLAGGSTMAEGSGAKDDPHPFTDEARALGIDLDNPYALAWIEEHLPELRRSASGQRLLYQSLGIGFVVGLAAHIGGYLLRSSATTELFEVLADLLYAFGFALWTGVVVVLFVQVIPEAKRRQIKRSLAAYEATLREKAQAGGDQASGDDGAPTAR